MQPDTLAIMSFTAFTGAGLTALLWTRLNRIEARIDGMIEAMARREELAAFRSEIRDDLVAVRSEVREDIGSLRGEVVAMRSDLTRIALAVGIDDRRASPD